MTVPDSTSSDSSATSGNEAGGPVAGAVGRRLGVLLAAPVDAGALMDAARLVWGGEMVHQAAGWSWVCETVSDAAAAAPADAAGFAEVLVVPCDETVGVDDTDLGAVLVESLRAAFALGDPAAVRRVVTAVADALVRVPVWDVDWVAEAAADVVESCLGGGVALLEVVANAAAESASRRPARASLAASGD